MLKQTFIVSFFIFSIVNSFSQQNGKNHFSNRKLCKFHSGKNATDMILSYRYSTFDSVELKKFILQIPSDSILNNKNHTLSSKLEHLNYSPVSIHLLFTQLINNREIHGAQIKVNLSKHFEFLSEIHHKLLITNSPGSSESDFLHLRNKFNTSSVKEYKNKVRLKETYTVVDQNAAPCIEIKNFSTLADSSYEYILGSNNRILCSRDLDLYFNKEKSTGDTLVKAWVFYPDPLTSAGVSYGGAYMDNDDKDTFSLTFQRKKVDIRVSFNNGIFSLKNNFVWIDEFDIPTKPVLTSDTNYFNYTRSEDGFEQVNAFYFINRVKDYIYALGFDSLCNKQIRVDVSGNGGADESRYSATGNFISFGEGGIDDAEDADVILHEYFHAITQSAAPGSANGYERICLEEANADYFAASYSKSINPFNWEKVFNWDGNTSTWFGRMVTSTKHYPEDFVVSSDKYINSDIWSATLMQIWNDLGREKTDRLLLQSLYSYSTNMNFTQAAQLILQADSLFYQKADYLVIGRHFYNRGIFSDSLLYTSGVFYQKVTGLINWIYLDQPRRSVFVHLTQPCDQCKVEVRDIEGRLLTTQTYFNTTHFDLPLKTIKTGMYFMTLYSGKRVFTQKCVFY